ncbi:MAG: D-glycero-beta-D-manno-heptose 1-phosphate adenylyltransferase [candidate division Zixibacteria bacterium]|nr:D-glycero-beta-D-manno-heptose 1-phosphate adenylyltransferase [candidate division Zixibacteria bacterium]
MIAKSRLKTFAAGLRRSRKRVVFTNGVFDLIHAGHVTYLTKAKALGDLLIVGLNTDASARINKGRGRPLVTYKYRAQVLAALEAVDFVVPLERETPDKLIELIRPHVLVKGADYKLSEIVGADFVKSYGGKVVRIKLVGGLSTSRLIEAIEDG